MLTDDIKKVVGHSARSETTAKVYDRAALEVQRRFSKARTERRKKTGAHVASTSAISKRYGASRLFSR
ncbi:hypothetical protein E0H22_06650 [Rhodopseudomonas boonkerdii]|nr:hypothetical protein E0H22_06650 [Rhodopseudomonas boonkerdii]